MKNFFLLFILIYFNSLSFSYSRSWVDGKFGGANDWVFYNIVTLGPILLFYLIYKYYQKKDRINDLTPGKYYYDGVSQKITDTLKQINISKEELLIKILDKINQKILKEYVLDYLPSDPFVIGYVCGCAHAFEGREKKSIELSILQNKIIKKYLKTDLSSDDFKKLINDTKNDFGEGFKSGLDLIFYNDVQNITHQTKLEGHILGYNRDSYGRKG